MATTTLTPAEFDAAKAAGARFIPDRDGFELDGVDYVQVITQPFADERGCLKYPHHAVYRRV